MNTWERARAEEKKKYCKKYYKGKYKINKKGCKKDPMCTYVNMNVCISFYPCV